jgi:ABC-type cobalamin transport system ATPase subunit
MKKNKKNKKRKKVEGCAEGRLMAQTAGMSVLRGSQQQIGRRLNHSSIESQSHRNFLLRSVAAHTAM